MILYHGSNIIINEIELSKCRPYKDFGQGFYCTEIKEQAELMAKRVARIYENLKYTRYSRNPKIARVLSEFGWVKELNEGVKRIYKEMSDYFLDEPKFSEPNMNSLKLTLKNNIVMRKIRKMEQMSSKFTPELWETLSSDEIAAIELAYKHNKVTTKMLKEEIDRGTKFARKVLNGLVEKEILDWNGTSTTDPKQYYCFIQQQI